MKLRRLFVFPRVSYTPFFCMFDLFLKKQKLSSDLIFLVITKPSKRFTKHHFGIRVGWWWPHNKKAMVSVWSLHVLPVSVWVFSGYSDFLPPPESKDIRFIARVGNVAVD